MVLLLVIHFLVASALIGFVLVQRNSESGGASLFGGDATNPSKSLFGSAGPVGFLNKLIIWATILFFVFSLALVGYKNKSELSGFVDEIDSYIDQEADSAEQMQERLEQTYPDAESSSLPQQEEGDAVLEGSVE